MDFFFFFFSSISLSLSLNVPSYASHRLDFLFSRKQGR
nr:uncharacterized protein CTRU02_13804 [Colletotrichum truncatum]KAF6782978.1 hypothetical protein CTRU02_13804 [Colletotrichum truncatum]